MKYVIRFMGLAGEAVRHTKVPVGSYLKAYDAEAHDGRGNATWTPIAKEALIFESSEAAMEAWKTQSVRRPLRPDGKPNRPLTAFSVEVTTL